MKTTSLKRLISPYPEFWILLVLAIILYPVRQAIAGTGVFQMDQIGTLGEVGPLFLATLGLGIFMIPGAALVVILGDDGDWWERLALAFVGSMAAIGIFSQIAAVMHTSIEFVLYSYLGLTAVFVVGAIVRLVFFPKAKDNTAPDRPPFWMWAILIVMVSTVVVFSLNARFDPDEFDAAAYVQNIRNDPHIMLTEPKFNGDFPISVRYYLDTWLTDQALISRITGQNPLDQYPAIRLSLTLLTLAAFYTFARRITNRKSAAVLSTIVWALYLILSNHDSVAGYEVLVRPDLDKVVAGFLVLPVGIGIVKTLFDNNRRRDWLWLVAAALAAMLTHPIAVALLGLSVVGWGIAELITQHNWHTFWRLALAGVILGLTLSPDVGAVVLVGKKASAASGAVLAVTLNDTRDPALVGETLTTLALERLYVLPDGNYIMHPRLVFQSFFLPAFFALPILLWLMRRSRGARMLFGMLTVVPLVILLPPTANAIGRLTTPWIFYRLHWPLGLAAVVTVGGGLAWLYDRLVTGTLPRIKVSIPRYGLAAAGLAAFLAFVGVNSQSIQTNLGFQVDSLMNRKVNCTWSNDLLRPFQQLATDPTMVLGDPLVNQCLTSAAPYAGVMEFRMEATVRPYKHSGIEQQGWDRLADFSYFETTQVVDQRLLQIIDKWKIQYVVVESGRPLNDEMRHMPGLFQPLYSADFESVYKVLATNQADPVIQANSLLSQNKFADAAAAFEKLQTSSTPDTRYLAQIGLGNAYQQLGRVDDALTVWGQAADSTQEGQPLALRGQVYSLRGQYDLAIQAYQQAIAREPQNLDWPTALGTALYHANQIDQAAAAFEAGVAITIMPNSASYHQALGSLWLGVADYDRAAAEFKQAFAMTGTQDNLDALGGVYVAAHKVPEAQATIRQMQNQDPWDEQVPLLQADLQALSGNWQSAADLTSQSLKLNPTVAGAYSNYAMYATLQSGTRAAVDQLKQLPGYRALQLGDASLAAANLETSLGQFDQADKDLVQALVWDGSNPKYWQGQGDVQLAQGNLDKATALYQKVIQSDLQPQPAYLALARIADVSGNPGVEQGYLLQGNYASPTFPAAQIALGNLMLAQGQPDLAQRQYQVALDTQPNNPNVLVALGDYHASRGEFDQALKYYQNAITWSPVSIQAYLGMASVYLSQGKVAAATDAINHAVQITPGVSAPRAALAALYSQQGNVDAALQQYKQAIDQNPGFTSGYVGLAQQYVGQDNTAQAQSVLQSLQQQLPKFQSAYIGQGMLAERRGDFAAAEASYRQALTNVSPSLSGSALLALGGLQSRQGKHDPAAQSYQTAIKQQPMLTGGYIALAELYAHDADYARATSTVKQGLVLSPGSADLTAELASLEVDQGHIQQAQRIYDSYLKLYPGALSIAIAKADLTAALGQPDTALTQIAQLQQQWKGASSLLNEQATLQMTNGNPQAAVDTAKALTTLMPGDTQSWVLLGQADSNLGQYQDAETAYRQATTGQPGSAPAWLALGEFLGTRNQMDPAATALTKSIQLDKAQTEPHIALADIKNTQGSQADAISEYKQAASLDLTQDDALLALGNLSSLNGDLNNARQYLDQALATSAADPRAYDARSSLYLKQGQADQANQILQKAIKIVPGNCQAYQNLGDYLTSLGQFDAAKSNYNQALSLSGCASSAHVSFGNLYRVQAKPTDAIAEYNKGITAQPGSALPYSALASFYASQNRQQDAQATYVQGLSRAPSSDLLTLGSGGDLIRIGQVQQGMDLVLKGADLRPASASNLLALGKAYELMGQNANAETSLLQAAKLNASASAPHLELGRVYMRMGRFDQALAEDNKAVQLAPGEAAGYTQLGDYYQSRAQYDQAIPYYLKATSLDQNQADSLIALGQLYAKLGRYSDAERTLQQALAVRNPITGPSNLSSLQEDATAPGSARALAALGDLYVAEAQPQKAEAAYKSAVQVAPTFSIGYLRLNQLYSLQNRPADALAQVKQAIQVNPASASALVALGTYQQSQGDNKGAEQSFLQAIAVAPIVPDGYIRLGQLYSSQGRQQDAGAQFLAAAKAAPGSVQALTALGDWQRLNAQWDSAEKSYRQAIAVDASDPSGYVSLAGFYQARAKNADALAQVQAAVKAAPASSVPLVALGNMYQSQLKWTDAEQSFKQAIAVNPTDPTAYVALSNEDVKRGKFDDAEAQLKLARTRIPGNTSVVLALAGFYSGRGQIAKAQDQVQTAASLQPGNVVVQIARAQTLAFQARFADAEQAFKAAIHMAPGLAPGYVALGNYLSNRGNWQDAFAQYQQALAIEPANDAAFTGLAKINIDPKLTRKQQALTQAQAWVKVAPPGDVSAMSALGEAKRLNGDFAGSVQAYQTAIDRLPGIADSYVGLAQTQIAQTKFGDAIQLLNRAAALNPSSVTIYMDLALAQYAMGQPDSAAASYHQAINADASFAGAYVSLAQNALAANQPDQGVQFYQQAIAAQPTQFAAYDGLATYYSQTNDPADALSTALKAQQMMPASVSAVIKVAQTQVANQDQVAALNALNQGLAMFPYNQGVILTEMGDVYTYFSSTSVALDTFHSAQARYAAEASTTAEGNSPGRITPYVREGDLNLDKLNNSQQALSLYQKAASIDGTLPDPYIGMMRVYGQIRMGRPTGVYNIDGCSDLPNLSSCDVPNLNRSDVLPGAAWNMHNGLDNTLRQQYEARAAANPNSVQAQMALGVLYEAYHLYDESIATWQHVLQIDPSNQNAYTFLSDDYALKELGRQNSANAMGQAIALGVNTQASVTRMVQLFANRITSLPDGTTIGSTVPITGTADTSSTGSNFPFSYYKLEYGVGTNPQSWNLITQSSTPVTNGLLGTWDTTALPNGTYSLRLVVVDTSGNYRPFDEETIYIHHHDGGG